MLCTLAPHVISVRVDRHIARPLGATKVVVELGIDAVSVAEHKTRWASTDPTQTNFAQLTALTSIIVRRAIIAAAIALGAAVFIAVFGIDAATTTKNSRFIADALAIFAHFSVGAGFALVIGAAWVFRIAVAPKLSTAIGLSRLGLNAATVAFDLVLAATALTSIAGLSVGAGLITLAAVLGIGLGVGTNEGTAFCGAELLRIRALIIAFKRHATGIRRIWHTLIIRFTAPDFAMVVASLRILLTAF